VRTARIVERLAGAPRPLAVELFAIANLGFLTIDVFIAHSINAFHYPIERIPVGFGIAGATVLLGALAVDAFDLRRQRVRWAGYLVGWLAIAVGLIGLFLHLRGTFFQRQSLESLVYTAPFVAPLSFAGLGFLVLLNRRVDVRSVEWGQWVLLLALGGFVGNFVLSLADHAQNGFFDVREWIPVVAAAFAVGFLTVALFRPRDRAIFVVTAGVLLVQAAVGLLGFSFHLRAIAESPHPNFTQAVLYGAPPFAPLLFCDLALLAAIAVWDLSAKSRDVSGEDPVQQPGVTA
jgi:hypothetical protein